MNETSDVLGSSIQYIRGVGPKLAKVLSKKGIATIEDALYFIPRTYEDRRRITPMKDLVPGVQATVLGKVVSARKIGGGGGGRFRRGAPGRFEAVFSDGSGNVTATWFHAFPSITDEFAIGQSFVLFGDVRFFQGVPQIAHPEYERVEASKEGKPQATFSFGRIVPVYSETKGLHQKTVRKIMGEVLKASMDHLDESLPEEMRTRLALPSLRKSFVALHFPDALPKDGELSQAVQRLVFEEFFVLQLGLCLKKAHREREKAVVLKDEGGRLQQFVGTLPFSLTGDQKKAIVEIEKDLASGKRLSRLVQGDVGSGKTVVGFAASVIASASGYQTAMMAPTELLAQQHFRNAEKLLKPIGIKPILVTNSNSKDKEIRKAVSDGSAQFVVGTHALFQKSIEFHKLGLVIFDEQHRFGVDQRAELAKKGDKPHLLAMTATPIPRTLALTLYGDLDLTIIREKPAGRVPIKTSIIWDRDRHRLYEKIRQETAKGRQVYIIYPLVENSEKLELKSATEMYESLKKEIFPDLKLTLVHGRMKGEEKDEILAKFKGGEFQILVSTTVIEVGIDVPNATLMVIEHPERLGLSQLHQLRGRVGRGSEKSECILVADKFVGERLKVMVKTEDGFEIAEEDLKIRGPGEFLGTKQSGLPGFRAGHILRDAELLVSAREEAHRILASDPELELPANRKIREMVESRWKEKIERLKGG